MSLGLLHVTIPKKSSLIKVLRFNDLMECNRVCIGRKTAADHSLLDYKVSG